MTIDSTTTGVIDVLQSWLGPRLDPQGLAWLSDRMRIVADGDKKSLFLSFGMAARKVGKSDLTPSDEERAAAERARPGWDPRHWTVDQAARMLLVLSYPASDAAGYVAVLDQLFAAGEVHELIALYQGLPLYPHQPAFQLRCAEGLRTNIKSVFCAIAHRNPYPSEQLNEDQWNQLVLKSLFIEVPLDPIFGLDRRANAKLAKILVDFARERWAAKRPVSPELWRCVGPYADDAALSALEQVLTTGSELERQAAALALRSSEKGEAAGILQRASTSMETPPATWKEIAERLSVVKG
jgi:hypothetical protein